MLDAVPSVTVWNRGSRGWFLRYPLPDGRTRAKRAAKPGPEGEAEARKLAAEANENLNAAKWRPLPSEPLPVDRAVRAWRQDHGPLRSERTRITDHGLVERLAEHFGTLDLRQLSNAKVREFAASVLDGGKARRSGSVAANAISILRRVVNLAVNDGLLDRNPVTEWARVIREARTKTAREASRRDAWTAVEAEKMLGLAQRHEPRLYPVLLAALHTGARRGELLALRWEDVDFARRRVYIRRAAAARGGTKVPKSTKPRMMPLSERLAAALRAHQKTQRRGALRGRPPQGWVFTSPATAAPWEEHNFARAWRRLRRKHFEKAEIRPLSFHCTRHTYITAALEAGTPTKHASEWSGDSIAVIERHYAHAIPSSWSAAFLDVVPGHETKRDTSVRPQRS